MEKGGTAGREGKGRWLLGEGMVDLTLFEVLLSELVTDGGTFVLDKRLTESWVRQLADAVGFCWDVGQVEQSWFKRKGGAQWFLHEEILNWYTGS